MCIRDRRIVVQGRVAPEADVVHDAGDGLLGRDIAAKDLSQAPGDGGRVVTVGNGGRVLGLAQQVTTQEDDKQNH